MSWVVEFLIEFIGGYVISYPGAVILWVANKPRQPIVTILNENDNKCLIIGLTFWIAVSTAAYLLIN